MRASFADWNFAKWFSSLALLGIGLAVIAYSQEPGSGHWGRPQQAEGIQQRESGLTGRLFGHKRENATHHHHARYSSFDDNVENVCTSLIWALVRS